MKTTNVKIRRTKSTDYETTLVVRHDYWSDRRRHSFASTRVRFS